MKIIKPSFEIIKQPSFDKEGIYKMIELAGRTCYKSTDKITEDSANQFVEMLIRNQHYAMLEHGTVYLFIPWDNTYDKDANFRYYNNKYSYHRRVLNKGVYVTTNLRVIIENNWLDDLKYLCEPTEYHEKRACVRFICDRGILAEFTRHRVFSFAAESSRYCNYSKDKFGCEITYILPPWVDSKELNKNEFTFDYFSDPDDKSILTLNRFKTALKQSEYFYMQLIKLGWKPEQARAVLPNALKTELIMTGFINDWKHFFELRCDSHAHPQARELAIPLRDEFIKEGYIN